jgi:hypothetical protein
MLGREGDPSESPLASQASGISGGFLRQIPTKMGPRGRYPRVRGWGGGAPVRPGGAAAQTRHTLKLKHFFLRYLFVYFNQSQDSVQTSKQDACGRFCCFR